MAAAKKKYRANWRIEGLTKNPIEPEQIVELVEDDALYFVELGVLSPAGSTSEETKGE